MGMAAGAAGGGGGMLGSPIFQMLLGAAGQGNSGGNPGAGALAGLQSSQNYQRGVATNQMLNTQIRDQAALSAEIAKMLQPQQQPTGMLDTMPNAQALQQMTGYQPQPISMPAPPMAPPIQPRAMPPAPQTAAQAPVQAPAQAPPAPNWAGTPRPLPTPAPQQWGQRAPVQAPQAPPQAPMAQGGGILQAPGAGGGNPMLDQATMGKIFQAAIKYPHSRKWATDGLLAMNKPGGETFRPMTGPERATYGLKEGVGGQIASPSGKASTFGGSGVTVNTGATPPMDELVKPKDLKNFVNDKGEHPDTIKTYGELRAEGFKYQPTPSEAAVTAGYAAASMRSATESMSEVLADPSFDPTSAIEAFGGLNNWTSSPEYQIYKSASDEWTTNLVFLRSGATAREDEKSSAFENFWPQGGDKPKAVLHKKRLRLMQERNAWNKAARAGRTTREEAETRKKEIAAELNQIDKAKKKASTGDAVLQYDIKTGEAN